MKGHDGSLAQAISAVDKVIEEVNTQAKQVEREMREDLGRLQKESLHHPHNPVTPPNSPWTQESDNFVRVYYQSREESNTNQTIKCHQKEPQHPSLKETISVLSSKISLPRFYEE